MFTGSQLRFWKTMLQMLIRDLVLHRPELFREEFRFNDDKKDNYDVYCHSIAFLEESVTNADPRFRKPRIFALPVFVRLFLSLPGWFSLL